MNTRFFACARCTLALVLVTPAFCVPTADAQEPAKDPLGVLRLGAKGVLVRDLQRTLNTRLELSPKLKIDGDFGKSTHEVAFSERADKTGGSTADIRTGERLKVRDLLFGLMLPSGNDASVALAEHFGDRFEPPERPKEKSKEKSLKPKKDEPGKQPIDPLLRFIAEMNRTAKRLRMDGTTYANPHGLTDRQHRSTAADLLRLGWQAMKLPRFREYVGTRQHGCQLAGPGGYRRNVLWKNTNRLLPIEGFDGIKTGTTSPAGACLVSSGRRGKDHLIVVVLGATSTDARYVDTRNLLRWAWIQRGHGKE